VRLGVIVHPKRMLGIPRSARIEPVARAWPLGVVLLGESEVWETGEIVRAHEEMPRGFTSENQRRRAELAVAARRGGFAEGETVHVGWQPLGDALIPGDEPMIRWSVRADPMPLARYLDERIELLLHPASGAD